MKHLFNCILFITLSLTVWAQSKRLERPKLVVGIVIDQMRWDYLYRYYDKYSEGGFKRLMREGFNCQNTFINYLPSFTGPGHSCIYTGSVPSIHGIASNDWIDNATGQVVYCAEDKTVKPVSGAYKAGRMSPRNLLTTTITDELKLATNMQSRVFAISLKDRSSIFPGGHLANGAYWFDDTTGNFMSSTYYGENLPPWLQAFNNKHVADSLISKDWELLYDADTYSESLPDNNPYENVLRGEKAPVFPHSVKMLGTKRYHWFRFTPGGNTLVFRGAKACIKGEGLGQGNTTDFLCMSFSAADYIAHYFTSNSVEAEDMYLRFDLELASFFNYLDKNVGEDNYTVFLTADHGGAHNPNYMKKIGIPAGLLDEDLCKPKLNAFLKTTYKTDSLIKSLINYQVYLNEDRIKAAGLDREEIKKTVIAWYQKQPGINYAVDMENMNVAEVPEPIRTMIINGYNRKRSGCIQVIYEPAWFGDTDTTGTTHGSWNPYDTHIPLLWYGWGIPHGETHRTTYMTDISATLAALLHIQMPNGCIGKVIEEVAK